jgi:hypothetical protein
MSTQIRWIEVWVDDSSRGEYLLVLQGLEDGSLEVVDPQEGRQVVATFAGYSAAAHWLREDEYELVEGRWLVVAADGEPIGAEHAAG